MIFREHAPNLWRALRRMGVRDADLEDVIQEVFLVVHRNLGRFEGRSSLRTWLYGIAIRVASDYRKRAYNRREVVRDEPPEMEAAPSQERELSKRRAQLQVDVLLQELDEDKRAVLVLFEIEQLPMTEVAEAVGCPLRTAYSRLHAARDQMRAAARRRRFGGETA